jgi:hypothetical protein
MSFICFFTVFLTDCIIADSSNNVDDDDNDIDEAAIQQLMKKLSF